MIGLIKKYLGEKLWITCFVVFGVIGIPLVLVCNNEIAVKYILAVIVMTLFLKYQDKIMDFIKK